MGDATSKRRTTGENDMIRHELHFQNGKCIVDLRDGSNPSFEEMLLIEAVPVGEWAILILDLPREFSAIGKNIKNIVGEFFNA